MCAGYYHSIFLDSDGQPWVTGKNECGQLGQVDACCSPCNLPNLPPIQLISCNAHNYAAFLDSDGIVWATGTRRENLPYAIQAVPNIQFVACSDTHTLLIDIFSKVWICKKIKMMLGGAIQLQLPITTKISLVACGSGFSFFLDEFGDVYSSGYNGYGQLGVLNYSESVKEAVKVQGIPRIESVACGKFHSLLLDADKSVWSCGYNNRGQLGQNGEQNQVRFLKIENLPNIQCVAAGYLHSVFVDLDGAVWGCGDNEYGQLGLPSTVKIERSPVKIPNLREIEFACCGENHSLFLDICGCVWSCGHNIYGQLGLGDYTNRHLPEKIVNLPAIKVSQACALTKSARSVV